MTEAAWALVVEDDPDMRLLLEEVLAEEGFRVAAAADGLEALEIFARREIDVVVTDLMMPGMKGRELLAEIRARRSDVPVIIITAFGNIESAVDSIKGGAYHYLAKPFRTEELILTVHSALRERRLMQELATLRAALPGEVPGIVAEGPAMRRVLDLVTRAAAADTPVLLLGESGTGKELLARALHRRSPRAARPFLAINCAAIPEALLESQLFGHRRGAFTDAREDRAGLFRDAAEGTVFLDEIGDMPLALQAKILRVLQEKEVHPLGASAPVPVDVRVVAATHRDLGALVTEGRFREDLYYRLAVIAVRIPPLRERPEDLLPLIAETLERQGRRLGRSGVTLSRDALEALQGYAWPGNVRELQNAIERALVLGRGEEIGLHDLPETVTRRPRAEEADEATGPAMTTRSLAQVEREHILRALRAVGGNKAAAARLLGMDRKTLYRRLESFRGTGPDRDEADVEST